MKNNLCPNCGSDLPLDKVWRTSATKGSWFNEPTGVECPRCEAKLVILQARAVIVGLINFVCGIACCIYGTSLLEQILERKPTPGEWMALAIPIVVCITSIHFKITPRFLCVRRMSSSESIKFPLRRQNDSSLEIDEEERKQLEFRAWSEELKNKPASQEMRAWICTKCREKNPGGFEVCWKCESAKPQ